MRHRFGCLDKKYIPLRMFVRRKKNKSGSTTIVVIDKSRNKFRPVRTFGTSLEAEQIENLFKEGLEWVKNYGGQMDLFRCLEEEQQELQTTEGVLSHIENILLNGAHLILGHVFKQVGFDAINDDILKGLVIARLCQPLSKSGTVDYLKSHFDEDIDLSRIYRYLDKLHSTLREKIQRISVAHTRKILGGNIWSGILRCNHALLVLCT